MVLLRKPLAEENRGFSEPGHIESLVGGNGQHTGDLDNDPMWVVMADPQVIWIVIPWNRNDKVTRESQHKDVLSR